MQGSFCGVGLEPQHTAGRMAGRGEAICIQKLSAAAGDSIPTLSPEPTYYSGLNNYQHYFGGFLIGIIV